MARDDEDIWSGIESLNSSEEREPFVIGAGEKDSTRTNAPQRSDAYDGFERVSIAKRPVVGLSRDVTAQPGIQHDTVIGARSRIRGTLQFDGRVRIDGTVDGEVIVEGELFVGSTGVMTGNITAESIQVSGRVKGDIHSEKRIELRAGSNVTGDLHCPRIVIQDGAIFDGSCFMGDGSALRDGLDATDKQSLSMSDLFGEDGSF